jgi:hypothetical protein
MEEAHDRTLRRTQFGRLWTCRKTDYYLNECLTVSLASVFLLIQLISNTYLLEYSAIIKLRPSCTYDTQKNVLLCMNVYYVCSF